MNDFEKQYFDGGWDTNLNDTNKNEDDDFEGGNNSAKLYERSRIKARR
jgi:hypothetical protein